MVAPTLQMRERVHVAASHGLTVKNGQGEGKGAGHMETQSNKLSPSISHLGQCPNGPYRKCGEHNTEALHVLCIFAHSRRLYCKSR